MHRNKYIYIAGILVLILASCIKPYEPAIKSSDAQKFVVSGQVIRGQQIQHVTISMTSTVYKPDQIPVTGCIVKILDDKNNTIYATDMQNGDYQFVVPENALTVGTSFKVDILTPGGVNIVSDFDQIFDCPAVDSVYYILKDLPTANPDVFKKGIQFYVDLNAVNYTNHYFRWEAIETYEYHMTWPIEWYFDGSMHHVWPPDYSKYVCWRTALVKNVFTLSTNTLKENKYLLYPLHFVDNYSSSRLVYGYSLLINQYAHSEAAYTYWDKMRINMNEQGGLYDKQPMSIKGNLHNITNPEQDVLGFFGAASMTSKRIFVSNVENLPIEFSPNCYPGAPMIGGLKEITPAEYPFYLNGNFYGYFLSQLSPDCVDCLILGGINVKPDFWPY
jgi:hypothetical protein